MCWRVLRRKLNRPFKFGLRLFEVTQVQIGFPKLFVSTKIFRRDLKSFYKVSYSLRSSIATNQQGAETPHTGRNL